MSSLEAQGLRNLAPRGDMRSLEAETKEETIANLLSFLRTRFEKSDHHPTPEEMKSYIQTALGLSPEEYATFPAISPTNAPEQLDLLTNTFLGISYLDSIFLPGKLVEIARKPARIFNGQSYLEVISQGGLNDILYNTYIAHHAEIKFA